jgi:hypothetical protein
MSNKTSPHILSTSANLLGFCLFVITSLRISNQFESKLIDQLTSLVALFLTFSCVFSFISIRSRNEQREQRLELVADYLFISSLFGILVIILMIGLNFI